MLNKLPLIQTYIMAASTANQNEGLNTFYVCLFKFITNQVNAGTYCLKEKAVCLHSKSSTEKNISQPFICYQINFQSYTWEHCVLISVVGDWLTSPLRAYLSCVHYTSSMTALMPMCSLQHFPYMLNSEDAEETNWGQICSCTIMPQWTVVLVILLAC